MNQLPDAFPLSGCSVKWCHDERNLPAFFAPSHM